MDLNFSAPATTKGYEKQQTKEVSKRRTTACVSYTQQYLYRRGFSEANLLEAMKMEKFEKGQSWHFITGGDVDNLSYLKVILLHQPHLDYVLFSTWRMAAEDLLQLGEWLDNGVIKKMDAYLGEIFPSTHHVEWQMINELFDRTQCGRIAVFRNHAKIIAGWGGQFHFTIESSANINTNPRTEQACITIDEGVTLFYKEFYDEIKSFC